MPLDKPVSMTNVNLSSATALPYGWSGDLNAVMARVGQVAIGSEGWNVLRAGARLALALPRNRRAAQVVIGLYQPHRWTGRAFQFLARILVATGLHRYYPKITPPDFGPPLVSWLQAAANAGTVGFLGANPVHGPRCILGGIDPTSGRLFVAKLGLDQSAAAVEHEHAKLELLHRKHPGVLESLGCEVGDGWALLKLPHLGENGPQRMQGVGVAELLNSWISEIREPIEENMWARNLIARIPAKGAQHGWHNSILEKCVNKALVHGDFAVWNTRMTKNGLCALDWEWAEENGIAGIDLAHGLRQECYMVHRMKPAKAVAWMLSQADLLPWKSYLNACGWGSDTKDWLRLGLLHSHFNAKNDSAELLSVLGIRL